jgi:hypothetical protein
MHVHPPKAVHGWREFAKEIMIIVIGVLIALGFEQVAEEIHWRHKVSEGEERLKLEGAPLFKTAAEAVVSGDCVVGQFDQLHDRVAGSGERLVPSPRIAADPNAVFPVSRGGFIRYATRTNGPGVWDTLRQDGTALHMAPQRQRRLAILYNLVALRKAAIDSLPKPPDTLADPVPLDAGLRGELLGRISDGRASYINATNLAVMTMGGLRDLGLAPPADAVDAYVAARGGASFAAFCRARGLPMTDWRARLARYPTMDQLGYD